MPASAHGPNAIQRVLRLVLAVGYLGVVVLGFIAPWQPRLFWTVLLPLLPVSIVLMGFSNWRRICPLAFFGEAGRWLNRGEQRRVPAFFERWFFLVGFGGLLVMLALRLVATNGDGIWLAWLLIGLALTAALVNLVYTGKTWCNFFCPVGFVERVYTEPNSLPQTKSSQCTQCTACKKNCPDIDQENAYWKDLTTPGRRVAIFAFPGLVLAFYGYYWLRAGDWEAYFGGAWTRHAFDRDLLLGPGFFFAPGVPAVVAASLTLVLAAGISVLLFVGIEALVARWVEDPARRRHLMLAVAAFAAFNLFYFFAGAPSLRRLVGGSRSVAFLAPALGTVFLAKRWRRTREHFLADQGLKRVLRSWPLDSEPPKDPGEVYGFLKASEHAREKNLEVYENTVREMITDGLVGSSELRLLGGIRKQLGLSEAEHEKIVARLSEEERHLFDGEGGGLEERAQLEGYQGALAEALLRGASESELVELQRGFGVSDQDHQRVLESIRGTSGPLLRRARGQLDRARELRLDVAALGASEATAATVFLTSLLDRARDQAVDRVFELLEIAGDGPMIQAMRSRLFSDDPGKRRLALELLAEACPGADDLSGDLEPLLSGEPPRPEEVEAVDRDELLARLLGGSDPYLRAAAVWVAAGLGGERGAEALARAAGDRHALVRETAEHFARGSEVGGTDGLPQHLSTIQTMHFLHSVPLFAELDPEDLHDLALFAVEERISPPDAICEAGDAHTDALFVVLEGEAETETVDEDGAGPARLGSGDVIGELSVLDGSPREATVRAVSDPVRVLRIQGPRLRGSLLRRPRVTQSLLAILAGRIRRLGG